MSRRPTRSYDWGFPRWRAYGGAKETARVRICDRHGCDRPGDCPAPKSPNNPDRWYFCAEHAAEYNSGWNYFEGLSKEDAEARARDEGHARSYSRAQHWEWAGPGDGSRSRAELDALKALELDSDADFAAVRDAYRRLAKKFHPDVNVGDAKAVDRFQAVQAAYDVLRRAEEAKSWKGSAE
jgi:hypothetical protein